jgi:hypothetical protein
MLWGPQLAPAGLLTHATMFSPEDRVHACCARAERFGVDYVDPSKRKDLRLEFRKERFQREGFTTGMDLFDEVCVRMIARPAKTCWPSGRQALGLHACMHADHSRRPQSCKSSWHYHCSPQR